MAYACMGISPITTWHETEDDVTVEMVVRIAAQEYGVGAGGYCAYRANNGLMGGRFAAHNALKRRFSPIRSVFSGRSARVGVIADRYLPPVDRWRVGFERVATVAYRGLRTDVSCHPHWLHDCG